MLLYLLALHQTVSIAAGPFILSTSLVRFIHLSAHYCCHNDKPKAAAISLELEFPAKCESTQQCRRKTIYRMEAVAAGTDPLPPVREASFGTDSAIHIPYSWEVYFHEMPRT